MSHSTDSDLIDRHLAGVLAPEEVAELEHLIRTSPAWARRYREAEEMARLLRRGLGGGRGAPPAVKRRIRREVLATRTRGPRLRLSSRPVVLAAAVLLGLVGAYLFVPRGGPGTAWLPVAYAYEPLPFKDLVRAADVGLIARTEMQDGRVRVRPVETLFGAIGSRGFMLPPDLEAGHEVALFGRYVGEGGIALVGGPRGIVHLDGVQPWEGKEMRPDAARAVLAAAQAERSLPSARADLRRFLQAEDSRAVPATAAERGFTGAVTARFLGRFALDEVRQPLLDLVLDGDKHLEARSAGAEALVASDAVRACRLLLDQVLQRPVETLRAETEDGQVVLSCLVLMRRTGDASLGDDLAALAARLRCPALVRAARDAAAAVTGAGDRSGGAAFGGRAPRRVVCDGHEALVVAGCDGRDEGVLVVFRGAQRISTFRPLIHTAVGHGVGVVVVPAGVRDVAPFLAEGRATGMLAASAPRYVVGVGAMAAAEASAARELPEAVVALAEAGRATDLEVHARASDVATLLADATARRALGLGP